MWTFTLASDVYGNLPEPVEMGWKMENSKYKIQWEDEDREREIKQNLLFLTKGCNCRKVCKTGSCGCIKRKNICGPACKCKNCTNSSIQDCNDGESRPSNNEDKISNEEKEEDSNVEEDSSEEEEEEEDSNEEADDDSNEEGEDSNEELEIELITLIEQDDY